MAGVCHRFVLVGESPGEKVALIQLDFAVRDSRIPQTGWIFGTFQYNGALSKNPTWNDLVPVGVMWGNDPLQTGNEYTNPQPSSPRSTRA